MANLRQDRVPESTLAHTSAASANADAPSVNGRTPASRGIVLSICLRISDSSGTPASVSPAFISWNPDTPAAALAIDILTASGGAPDPPQGAILQSRFFNLQSALLAARRLQWAMEGLAENSGAATGANLSIHSTEDSVAGSVAKTLQGLLPGQVLLSAGMAEAVRQLPGLAMRPGADARWMELQWRSDDSKNFAADEQAVTGLIRALGRQDPVPPQLEQERPPSPPATPVPATTGAFQAPASFGRSLDQPESAPGPFWKRPWVIVSAGAAVLVVLAVLIIPAMVSSGRPKAPVPDAPAKTAPPAPSPVTPPAASVPPAPEEPRDQKPAVKPGRQPRTPANPGTATGQPQPKPAAGSCDLTEGEIPLSLQRAERLMYAGKLDEAQDAYQHLVGCPSAREKALDGLRQVKQRIGFHQN